MADASAARRSPHPSDDATFSRSAVSIARIRVDAAGAQMRYSPQSISDPMTYKLEY
jgi:hypothetical protein